MKNYYYKTLIIENNNPLFQKQVIVETDIEIPHQIIDNPEKEKELINDKINKILIMNSFLKEHTKYKILG